MSPEESAQRMYSYLSEALSEDPTTRQNAETNLRQAEEQQDFFASLAQITAAVDEEVESRVRWLAAVCGKNAVSRSWRRRTNPNQVTEDERTFVKDTLLSTLHEKHSLISSQTCLWIGNIARSDYPKQWPTLLDDLSKALDSNNFFVMKNATDTMDIVLKQLSSRRLLSDRKSLYMVAPRLFEALYKNFCTHVKNLTNEVRTEVDPQISFQIASKCLKSFRRLVAYGCTSLHDLPLLNQVFIMFISIPTLFIQTSGRNDETSVRLSYLAAKLIRVTHEKHPVDFQPFLQKFLEVYFVLLINFNTVVSNDRISYQGAYFLRNCVQCHDYEINSLTISQFEKGMNQLDTTKDNTSQVSKEMCRSIVLGFFNRQRVDQLVQAMIEKVFVLSQIELNNWAEDPETLVREEEAAAEWGTNNLRHECEELLKILLIRDKKNVVPLVLRLAESVPRDKPLLLDACYRAVGRAVYDIQGAFDFDVWLNGQLKMVLEAECSQNLGERIIQARTAWLVAQFCEQLTRDSRNVVNPLLVRLMTFVDKDRVISLTATKAIQTLIEDLGFNANDFAPHLHLCLHSAFQIIHSSELMQTKRDVLTMVSSLMDRMLPEHIAPVIEMIADAIPQIWESNAKMNGSSVGNERSWQNDVLKDDGSRGLLHATIGSLLTTIVEKTGPVALASAKMSEVIGRVLEFSLDRRRGMGAVFMIEEGCALWIAVLSGSIEYTPKLKSIFPLTESVLGDDLENLKEVFDIIEGYVLLGGHDFMREYSTSVMNILRTTLESTNNRGCMSALNLLDEILLKFPIEGVGYAADLLQILLTKVISRVEGQTMMTAFIGVLDRAIVSNVSEFTNLVLKSEDVYYQFLQIVIDNIESMFRFSRKKLAIASLCSLTGNNDSNIQSYKILPQLIPAMVHVMREESSAKPRSARQNSEAFEQAIASPGMPHESREIKQPGMKRLEELHDQDIVKRFDVKGVCRELLLRLQRNKDWYDAAIQATNSTTLQKFETLVTEEPASG